MTWGWLRSLRKVALKATQEWKEEIVYFNADGGIWHPRTKQLVKPKVLGGEPLELGPEEDPRVKFAEWLTSPQNPWFAQNAVNRVWTWLLGRGIVQPADDFRSTNPPENSELLEYLSQELIGHQFDLRHIYRLILNSRTYQLSSTHLPLNEKDTAHFSHYGLKRLGAEQLLDAIDQVTGSSEPFSSWIPVPALRLPTGYRATQLPDSDIDCTFLEVFGRPSRDTPYEGDRNSDATARQAMFFISSDTLQWKIAGGQRIRLWLETQKTDADVIEEIYLAALHPAANGSGKAESYRVYDGTSGHSCGGISGSDVDCLEYQRVHGESLIRPVGRPSATSNDLMGDSCDARSDQTSRRPGTCWTFKVDKLRVMAWDSLVATSCVWERQGCWG